MLVAALLDWFSRHARDLPWRRTRDPYAIWVSEIMLQQTQVKTVIPYWERWMRELPTIESAAQASPAKLHKLWEGLGYYTRVCNLQKAARQIIASQSAVAADVSPPHPKSGRSQSRLTSAATVQKVKARGVSAIPLTLDEERDGARGFPTNFDDLLSLPGIGRYTAGAICSIAFNQPKPILDGNVIRVLTRIHGIKSDPREKKTNERLWQLAEELVTHAHAGWGERTRGPHAHKIKKARRESRPTDACSRLNQSLMELGALICTPRSPNCPVCPVQKLCVARIENLQERLPNPGKRAITTERRFVAFVVERAGRFLVRQRPAGVVNAHLWEFPNVEIAASGGRARHSVRAADGNSKIGAQRTGAPYQRTDFRLTAAKPLCVIKHSITRYRITLEAWRAESECPQPPAPGLSGHWLTLRQLRKRAFTSAHKKILSQLAAPP